MSNLKSLEDLQIQRELECFDAGVTTYRSRVDRLKEKKLEGISDPLDHLIKVFIDPFRKGLIEWIIAARSAAGRHATALQYIEPIDANVAGLITMRVVLNGLSRRQNYQTVCKAIGGAVEDELRMAAFEAQNERLYNRIQRHVKESPHGYRQDYRRRVNVHAMNKYHIVWDAWDQTRKTHVGAALLGIMVQHTGMVSTETKVGRSLKERRTVVVPSSEMMKWVIEKHAACEVMMPLDLPMCCPPRPFTDPHSGGYLDPRMRHSLVRERRLQSLDLDPAKMPVVYRSVNLLQATQWERNEDAYQTILHLWETAGSIPGAASSDVIPLPPKPERHSDTCECEPCKSSWALYKAKGREVHNANQAREGRLLAAAMTLYAVRRTTDAWFPVKLDFRSRIYYVPTRLTPQGSDLSKGLLRFKNGKPLGPGGYRWLVIHAANCFGYDKVTLDERFKWGQEHLNEMLLVYEDPLSCAYWHKAKNPVQFLAVCLELGEYFRCLGSGEDFKSHLPIWQDGSCNGTQHLSALSRDAESGAQVNLIPGDKPADIYATVAKEVIKCLQDGSGWPQPSRRRSQRRGSSPSSTATSQPKRPAITHRQLADLWLAYGVDRDVTKRPTMIVPYGGTRRAFETYVDAIITERLLDGKPHPFGQHRRAAVAFLATVLWNSMDRVMPGPKRIMAWTRAAAAVVNKAGRSPTWKTPANFPVLQQYFETESRRVTTRMGDQTIKVTLVSDTDKLDTRRQAQSLAPNWIHSLDATALQFTLCRLADLGITDLAAVHDSYATHACDTDTLNTVLREEFVRIYSGDVLGDFVRDLQSLVTEPIPAPPPLGTLHIPDVLRSKYFFA